MGRLGQNDIVLEDLLRAKFEKLHGKRGSQT